eukprot:763865-Hanusia_phi.AAC.1
MATVWRPGAGPRGGFYSARLNGPDCSAHDDACHDSQDSHIYQTGPPRWQWAPTVGPRATTHDDRRARECFLLPLLSLITILRLRELHLDCVKMNEIYPAFFDYRSQVDELLVLLVSDIRCNLSNVHKLAEFLTVRAHVVSIASSKRKLQIQSIHVDMIWVTGNLILLNNSNHVCFHDDHFLELTASRHKKLFQQAKEIQAQLFQAIHFFG